MIKNDDTSLITLAIGDGANDVSMIREAHVGIGLFGNEGERAAQSADMALSEFRFLWRLLFWHGATAYMRNSELILYFFYKNVLFTLPHVMYTYANLFSGQTIFDEWFISFYNTFFTACPNNFRACADLIIHPDLDGPALKDKMPLIYYVGRYNTIFTGKNFLWWAGQGLVTSLVLFFFTMYAYTETGVLDAVTG